MDFGYLLENPRRRRRRKTTTKKTARRRRSPRRRSSTRRRRRATIVVAANPRRRRRRGRRSTVRRRSSRRRNPAGLLGGLMPTVNSAVQLTIGELIGDMLARAAVKFTPLGRMTLGAPFVRIGVGLFAGPLLKMLKLPAGIRTNFGAINVASGIMGLTAAMRAKILQTVGLSDYEFADYEFADYELAGAPPAGILGTPPPGIFGDDDEEEITLLDSGEGYSY